MKKDYAKRDRQIQEWRKQGLPQTEIASRLNITRQRVQQIERRLGLGLRRSPGVYKEYTFNCKECKKGVSLKLAGRIYCSRVCFFKSREVKRTPEEETKRLEERREKNRLRSKSYYHGVFKKKDNWREVVKKRNKKYAEKKGTRKKS